MKNTPRIIPIRELKNTNSIDELCRGTGEPIFVTKNGYSELLLTADSDQASACHIQAALLLLTDYSILYGMPYDDPQLRV